MIKVESKKLSSEECNVLASITKSARKDTPLEFERSVEDVARGIESVSTNDDFQLLIASDEAGSIVGWTYYYVAFPLMDFISGFFPLVEKNNDFEKIALSLIEASKRDTVERGQSRLEIELVFPTDAHRAHSETFVDLYRKCGFEFAAEEVHMKSDLTKIELPELDPPKGYTPRNFSDVSYDLLEDAGFQTFESGNDDLFLSMSNAEQKVTLEHYFDHSAPFIPEASLVIEKEGKVIGFVVTRVKGDEAEIGPIGLIPESRGQGFGSFLLVRALAILKDIDKTNVSLDVSVTNTPAKKFYEKYGFEEGYYKQFHYWSP